MRGYSLPGFGLRAVTVTDALHVGHSLGSSSVVHVVSQFGQTMRNLSPDGARNSFIGHLRGSLNLSSMLDIFDI